MDSMNSEERDRAAALSSMNKTSLPNSIDHHHPSSEQHQHIPLPACLPLPQFHWMTASLTIPFSTADIGATLPSSVPVLNRGAGPSAAAAAGAAPPPKRPVLPPPPSPPPQPAAACARGAKCCLNGVNYSSCQTDSSAGFPFTQLYRVANGTLHVGIRSVGCLAQHLASAGAASWGVCRAAAFVCWAASCYTGLHGGAFPGGHPLLACCGPVSCCRATTTGWIAWGMNQDNPSSMVRRLKCRGVGG